MRVRLAVVPFVAAAAFLAGCDAKSDTATAPTTPAGNGVEALPADEILTKAKAALTAATSYHVKGDVLEEGQIVKYDLTVAGKDVSGTAEMQGLSLEVIKVGDDLYMKASDKFWADLLPPGEESSLAMLKGKYVKADATSGLFAPLGNAFTAEEMLKPKGTFSKGETKTFDGVPAIGLIDSKDKSVLYVATQGEPLPLAFESPDNKGVARFTEYNQPVEITAPPAAEVFDSEGILGG
jgi:hypothetical protein